MKNATHPRLKLAVAQMVSSAVLQDNLEQAEMLIIEAANHQANMVVLPEYFAFMGFKEKDKLSLQEEHLKGPVQERLRKLSKKYNIWIIAGTFPIKSDQINRPFGRCYVYNDRGETITWYDKIHLFDVKINDEKGNYCESTYTKAGEDVVCFDSPWGRIGLAVCYDLRFPELFRQLQAESCELLILPAAFTYQTGKRHWQTLIKARAIENLCYFAASAQGGQHQNGRETWGHSCVISPWGETLDQLELGQSLIYVDIDRDAQTRLRQEFPVLEHKKL